MKNSAPKNGIVVKPMVSTELNFRREFDRLAITQRWRLQVYNGISRSLNQICPDSTFKKQENRRSSLSPS